MKNFAILTFIFLLWGCDNDITSSPSANIIPKEEMVQILADIHLAEAYAETQQVYSDTITMLTSFYYREIFALHEIDEEDFRKSMEYYLDNPKIFDEIYVKLIEELSTRSADFN